MTSAAAIMVVVFAVFVTLELTSSSSSGSGSRSRSCSTRPIIRSVLLPASMRLLGDWNWWLPGFLGWLPQVTIEGEPEDEDSRGGPGRRKAGSADPDEPTQPVGEPAGA